MVGSWFTTPWRLVSQSHGAVAWRFLSPILPHVPFFFATSRHRPILCVPWFPYAPGLSCCPIPSLIPCLYRTGPAATLWRGPTGSSSIWGPFRAPSTGRSLPAPAPFPCAASRHPPRPIPRVPRLPSLLGPLCGSSHTPFSVLSPFPSIPCLYPTGPPATLWHGPTGSSSIRGPFRVPSTGRSLPAPFRLGGVLPSGPVVGPSSWPPRPPLPVPFPHLVTCCCCFFIRAPTAVSRLPVCSFPFPRRLLALCFTPSGGAVGFCFWFCFFFAPPFPAVHPALWFPPPCMHAHQHSTGHLVTAPLDALAVSHRPLGAWPLAVPGHSRWAPLPRVSLRSPLSPLPSLLSPVRPLTVVLLLRVLSAGRPRAMAVSRALQRASGPPPCPRTCRPTWAATPDTPSGGLSRRPPPPASPPSVP